MRHIITTIKNAVIVSLAVVLFNIPATGVFADTAACVPPDQTQAGVRWPTGSDAGTFVYQCDGDYSGKWINDYYLYDPATNTRTARYDYNYRYDCTTQQWYRTEWDFTPADNSYHQYTVQTTNPGGIPTGCPTPVVPATIDPAKTVDTNGDGVYDSPTTPETLAAAKANGGSAINLDGTLNSTFTYNTNAAMTNTIGSQATTGGASVIGNTTGGSATSGNAQAIANIINLLQSSSNVLNDPNLITFTANINGDVNGDLLLDPAQLSSVQSANTADTLDNNVTINNSLNTAINNNVVLGANSGDATVAGNTTGGNATSGTADAVANIVNILNSAVTAGRSFMGVININGNLNGDILLPPNFVDTLLASNVPHYTVNTANLTNTNTVTNNTNQAISNVVDASATSGSASVAGNTTGGSATSGLANTNLTVFNLTGSNVVASNDLLVFVNVLGTWYGMIMNAPAGTTAASLGGGVTSNTNVNNTATLNDNANESINNNVKVSAGSGNANVTNNTTGGNATSGDATASVNIMNMINNSLTLNGWFGLLFINVFGTWNGSFGIDTAAGNPVVTGKTADSSSPMFQFMPVAASPGGSNSHATYRATGGSGGSGLSDPVAPAVEAANTVKKVASSLPSHASNTPIEKATNQFLLPALGVVIAGFILVAGERSFTFRRH